MFCPKRILLLLFFPRHQIIHFCAPSLPKLYLLDGIILRFDRSYATLFLAIILIRIIFIRIIIFATILVFTIIILTTNLLSILLLINLGILYILLLLFFFILRILLIHRLIQFLGFFCCAC